MDEIAVLWGLHTRCKKVPIEEQSRPYTLPESNHQISGKRLQGDTYENLRRL